MTRRRLLTETQTRAVERRIRGAFRVWSRRRSFTTHFEHGQWWVITPPTAHDDGNTYAVNDATGPNTVDGFDFEALR